MSCEKTKTHLFDLINSPETVEELIQVSCTVETVLKHTEGLWQEARYCYKAKEIAERLVARFDEILNQDDIHHKTAARVKIRKYFIQELVQRYHELQQERFSNPNWWKEQQVEV